MRHMSRSSFAYFNLSPLLLPFTSNSSHKLWGLLCWGLVFILTGLFFFFFKGSTNLEFASMCSTLLPLRVASSWVCCSWPVTLFLFWMYPGKSCQIQNFLLPQPIFDLSGLDTTGSEWLLGVHWCPGVPFTSISRQHGLFWQQGWCGMAWSLAAMSPSTRPVLKAALSQGALATFWSPVRRPRIYLLHGGHTHSLPILSFLTVRIAKRLL